MILNIPQLHPTFLAKTLINKNQLHRAMSLQNVWHLRKVAETAAKACYVCYKPSSSVLITPDNKDFFYICPAHLKDRNFGSPIVDTAGAEAKLKQEALDREIENVKKEYEEKQKKKREKKAAEESKEKDDEQKKDADKDSSTKNNAKSDEKERDDKIHSLRNKGQGQGSSTSDDSPRVFALHKNFYQMRLDRLRNIEMAKRTRQRIQDPSFFPSAPSGGV